MKNIQRIILGFLLMNLPSLQALPLGNPWDASLYTEGAVWCPESVPCPKWCDDLSYRAGYYGDFVNDRHLRSRTETGEIRETNIRTNALMLVLNAYERAEVFVTIGASRFALQTSEKVFLPPGQDVEFLETETDLSLSLGGRVTLWKCGNLGIGAEAQYFTAQPKLNFLQDTGNPNLTYLDGEKFKYREFQFGVGASYCVCLSNSMVLPYIGLTLSGARVEMGQVHLANIPDSDDEDILYDLETTQNVGWAVGFTFLTAGRCGITLEKRFFDERAFTINAQVRF